jgi:hypothetical protein
VAGSVAGSSEFVQKEPISAELREVEASSGVHEGCDDGVRMVNVQSKVAKIVDSARPCLDKVEERRGTLARVVIAKEKMVEAPETLGSSSNKVEEGMGALTRVVTAQRKTVEAVGSSWVCIDKAKGSKGVENEGLSS